MSFAVGDKIKLRGERGFCYLGESLSNIAYFKATYLGDCDYVDYQAYDSEGNGIGSCSCWKQYEFEPYEHIYKVGDKLIPNATLMCDCDCEWHDAAYIQITSVGGNDDYYYYDVREKNGDFIEACSGHQSAFESGMEYYKEVKFVSDVPLAPTDSLVGTGTTTMSPNITVEQSSPTVARIGWNDESVFIPRAVPEEEPKVGTINIVPVTNAKHSANLRKLIGHRNFKSRVAA